MEVTINNACSFCLKSRYTIHFILIVRKIEKSAVTKMQKYTTYICSRKGVKLRKSRERLLFLILALASGIAFLFTDFYNTSDLFYIILEKIFFGSYILCTFLFFRAEIQYVSNINGFLEILWKGFLTSIVFFLLVFIIRTFDNWNTDANYDGKSFVSLIGYHLVGMALIVFQGTIYNVFKKLSFYPKVKIGRAHV